MKRFLLLALCITSPALAEEWFISPQGSDHATGKSPEAALHTFARAFSRLRPGDTLTLLDGTYTLKTTGLIRDGGNGRSAAPPSGHDRRYMTRIRALHPGRALLLADDGVPALLLGTHEVKRRNIRIEGLRIRGGAALYNTHRIHLRALGIEGGLSIGTNDHYEGNDHNLVEDSWIFGHDRRLMATNYRANHNIWRRVLVSSTGCNVPGCNDNPGKADPSAGITIYDSHHVSMQNVIVLDRRLDKATGYADFSSAQHTEINASFLPEGIDGRDFLLSDNEWLGCISAFSEDAALVLEADNVKPGAQVAVIRDFVALFPGGEGAMAISNRPYNFDGTSRFLMEHISIHRRDGGAQAGIYVSPELGEAARIHSALINGGKGTGIIAGSRPKSVQMTGPGPLLGKYTRCGHDCRHGGKSPPWPFLPGDRVPVKPEQRSGQPGATIWWRIGRDGSFEDDTDSRKITAVPLWPWPYEQRIRREFCHHDNMQHGWCASRQSLTRYLWSALGNEPPAFPSARHSR